MIYCQDKWGNEDLCGCDNCGRTPDEIAMTAVREFIDRMAVAVPRMYAEGSMTEDAQWKAEIAVFKVMFGKER